MTSRGDALVLVSKVGALAALVATILSAFLIAVLSAANPPGQGTTSPSALDIVRTTFLLCPITAVSCGSFGLIAGLAGSALLYLRRRRIRSTVRLVVETTIIGFFFGLLFPFFDRLMNPPSFDSMKIFLSAPVGILCALFCTLAFRRRLVTTVETTSAAS